MRPFEADDLDGLTVLHREEFVLVVPHAPGNDPEETARFLDRVLTVYEHGEVCFHALIERSNGSVIGWAGLSVPHVPSDGGSATSRPHVDRRGVARAGAEQPG